MARFVGAKVVPLPLLEERGFTFAPEDLAARLTPKTKLVVLNSPANPTGGLLDKTDIEAVADILRDHDCYDPVRRDLLADPVRAASTTAWQPSRTCSTARSSWTASRRRMR